MGVIEIQKRCSKPLMNFAKKTPETQLFFDAADLKKKFCLNWRETEESRI